MRGGEWTVFHGFLTVRPKDETSVTTEAERFSLISGEEPGASPTGGIDDRVDKENQQHV
jgi:hypothetical protein